MVTGRWEADKKSDQSVLSHILYSNLRENVDDNNGTR